MPVVNYQQYQELIDKAQECHYAYPAFNVTSFATVNAVLAGLAEKKSDGIIQVSTGGGEFAAGQQLKNMALGAEALASYVRFIAEQYNIFVVLHTDHCPVDKLATFLNPLLQRSRERKKQGLPPLFSSHMFDGSALPLEENLTISKQLLSVCEELDLFLEVEIGVVGGEEDGVKASQGAKLYTSPADILAVAERLGTGSQGKYLLAATFGNVHGVYKPGAVQLQPKILAEGQAALTAKYGAGGRLPLVFHGGSGSSLAEIRETLAYGVVKMNVDTDTQYAFTRALAEHFFKHYDRILKVDGEVGDKKFYDPRSYLKKAELGMKQRVMQVCDALLSSGKSLLHN